VHSRFVYNLVLVDLATIYWLAQKSLLCNLPTKDALIIIIIIIKDGSVNSVTPYEWSKNRFCILDA
jgi:hypothetical protein